MQWIVEDSLTNFKFWSGGADRAKMLEYSDLKELDDALPAYFLPPNLRKRSAHLW